MQAKTLLLSNSTILFINNGGGYYTLIKDNQPAVRLNSTEPLPWIIYELVAFLGDNQDVRTVWNEIMTEVDNVK